MFISETLHNYIDFENHSLVRVVGERDFQNGDANSGTMLTDGIKTLYALDEAEIVDISSLMSFDGTIDVDGKDLIYIENENKVPMPSTITYQIKLTKTEG